MTPGFYLFRGQRRKGGTAYIESINAPVEIVEIAYHRKPKELAVKMIGRQQAFPLINFDGVWMPIRTKEGA